MNDPSFLLEMDLRNPFTNAKVAGLNIQYSDIVQQAKRGEIGYSMTRSELVACDICPEKWIGGARDDETVSTEWGSLIDALMLQPAGFSTRYAVSPEFYTSKKGIQAKWTYKSSFCSDWKDDAEASGLIPIKYETHQEAL